MAFLRKIWSIIKRVMGLLLPIGKRATWKLSPGVRWTLHILLIVLVLVGLYFLSQALRLHQLLPINQTLARIWLPLLVFLTYILLWFLWWLYKLWISEEEVQEFPDIEEAWNEGVQALNRAGIALTEVPLFLLLGRPEADEANLFQAARMELLVPKTPARSEAPLHVYGNRDAVFVSCANTCLLGRFAAFLALEGLQDWPMMPDPEPDSPAAATGTLIPGAAEKASLSSPGDEEVVGEGRPGSALERRSKRRLLNLKLPNLLHLKDLVDDSNARMTYLGQLIVRDRRPFCPINGILLLLPLGLTDSDEEARQATEIIQRDLATVRKSFRMRSPIFALVCDLETTWGFYEFLQRQKPESKLQRLGQRFPLSTDLEPALLRDQLESSVRWMCNQVTREWVYLLFKTETDEFDRDAIVQGNTRLYRLLEMMHQRQKQLSTILKYALLPGEETPGQSKEPWFYGGCYLAATGAEKDKEQAFVRGVFDRLIDSQEFVCWTEDAVRQEARLQSQTSLGYLVLAGLWALVVLVFFWQTWR